MNTKKCPKCGEPLEIDLITLNEGCWYCPQCHKGDLLREMSPFKPKKTLKEKVKAFLSWYRRRLWGK